MQPAPSCRAICCSHSHLHPPHYTPQFHGKSTRRTRILALTLHTQTPRKGDAALQDLPATTTAPSWGEPPMRSTAPGTSVARKGHTHGEHIHKFRHPPHIKRSTNYKHKDGQYTPESRCGKHTCVHTPSFEQQTFSYTQSHTLTPRHLNIFIQR